MARRARELVWSQGESSPGQKVREAAEELQRPPQSGKTDDPTRTSGAQEQSGTAGSVITQWMQLAVGSVLALAGHITVIFFLVFFLLISGGHFKKRIIEIAGRQLDDRRTTATISAAALVITSLEGWLLTPPLLGKAEHMHAVVVFLGVLVWTWIWGAWGTILAVPMLVIVKSIADHVDSLKPVSRLMSP